MAANHQHRDIGKVSTERRSESRTFVVLAVGAGFTINGPDPLPTQPER